MITLGKDTIPERVLYGGETSIVLQAGKNMQIRTKAPVDVLMDETVPDGKSWKVHIRITVEEQSL